MAYMYSIPGYDPPLFIYILWRKSGGKLHEAVDMNGRFQMQGGKNWILPKYVGQCKPVLLGLSLAGNLVKPLLSLYGTEWRERGYGLCIYQSPYL